MFLFFFTLQTDNNTKVWSNHSYLGLILKRLLPIATVKKNALEAITLSEEGLTVFPICRCTLGLQHATPTIHSRTKHFSTFSPIEFHLKTP